MTLVFLVGSMLISPTASAQEITFARPDIESSISVSSTDATRFRTGAYETLHLRGEVKIQQQQLSISANEAILWVEVPDVLDQVDDRPKAYKVIVYLEGGVAIDLSMSDENSLPGQRPDRIVDEVWLGRLYTASTVDLSINARDLGSDPRPSIFTRAQLALENGLATSVAQTQFQTGAANPQIGQGQFVVSPQTGVVQQVVPGIPVSQGTFSEPNLSGIQGGPQPTPVVVNPNPSGTRVPQATINFAARDSAADFNGTYQTNPNNPNEGYFIGTGGVRVTIDSEEIARLEQFRDDEDRQVVILADNVVVWQSTLSDGSTRREAYLEGNVIFAKDRRVIYAKQMYYDANFQRGTILDAEVLTTAQQYQGLVRLKADVIQQVDENNLQAYGTAFTTSRIGVPRYWLQSESVGLNRRQTPRTDPLTGAPVFDQSGVQAIDSEYFLEANSNRVYAGGIPVFAWPRYRTSLDDPGLYLKRFKIGNDNDFGTQVQTAWNLYKLLGFRKPPAGTSWVGLLDYLSERGVGFGSEFTYQRNSLFGVPGNVSGFYQGWFIDDKGNDFLGRGRRDIPPEKNPRGRILARHFHQLSPGHQLKAELGYISDRNFLEQYYEREWDTYKDATTGLWLQKNRGTQSFNLIADIQINDFFAQTSWLPRFDHFILGQPLARDKLVWHGHSHIGYGRLRAADPPEDPTQLATYVPLAWEADVDGLRAGTRQEIDLPVQLGPVKVVPYVLGDATFWQEDLSGNDLFRGYGQAGIKASLPFWRVDPTIQSVLWNVNGLAHKLSFDVDAYYADASQDLDELPLYDQVDDDAQEAFRREFAFNTFGILAPGNIPLKFDERYFALRSGMQGNVSAHSLEIADDLEVVTLGFRQRWQTKRGLPGQERIIDWITLDMETSFFPDPTRDNFGSTAGLFNYDFSWYVGDRLSVLSDGFLDFFEQGLRTASLGFEAGRPGVGTVYMGFRSIEGPISVNILTASAIYRMSEKWGIKGSSQYDFGEVGTIGNTLSLYYIGESFLWQLGLNADFARENFGFRFGFEPRFVPRSRLFNPGGVSVGPASARWLE